MAVGGEVAAGGETAGAAAVRIRSKLKNGDMEELEAYRQLEDS